MKKYGAFRVKFSLEQDEECARALLTIWSHIFYECSLVERLLDANDGEWLRNIGIGGIEISGFKFT